MKWVECMYLTKITKGYYAIRLYQPDTKTESIELIRLNDEEGEIRYYFATHYCKIELPELNIK